MHRISWKRAGLAVALGASLGLVGFVALADYTLPPKDGFPPDPPGHASTKQWMFNVVVTHGVPDIASVRTQTFDQPFETGRVVGRFAIEFYVGPELLDRIRFDIPLMGTGPVDKSPRHPYPRPNFDDVNTHLEVRLADHPRAVYAVLVDRAKRTKRRYEWPPTADGHLVPWKDPEFSDAWPPPGISAGDGGPRDAAHGG